MTTFSMHRLPPAGRGPKPTPPRLGPARWQGLREAAGGLVWAAVGLACAGLPAAGRAETGAAPAWRFNQLGFLPGSAKWLVLAEADGPEAEAFEVVDTTDGRVVLSGRLSARGTWPLAGEAVQLADASALARSGSYRVRRRGGADSEPFVVSPDAYRALGQAAQKAYYFNRASTDLRPEHAGAWARAAGHPDQAVRIHPSAAGPRRRAGDAVAAPKGWYDAGDYNKYVVNAGISTATLLSAWEHFPEAFREAALNLPESGQGLPDLLAEVLWNLEWMLAMQDPADGGVYHKLSNAGFDGMVMPADARAPRYLVAKSTAAALDFAAVMAQASRVLRPFEAQHPGRAARLLAAARSAWAWAVAHPRAVYRQPPDIQTGTYDDRHLEDEFAWAAVEFFVSTGEARWLQAARLERAPIAVPSWDRVQGLAWMTLAHHRERLPDALRVRATQQVLDLGARLAADWARSPYRVGLQRSDLVWGSNAVLLNQAVMLLQAHRLSGERAPLDAAQAALDYVLGRNPLALSYVTGFGARSPRHPHHRPSEADGVADPVPGWLVGGPNPGRQDAAHCPPYPAEPPLRAYLDRVCSYASNEVAINWNAPLVYVSAALQRLTPPR